MSQSIILKRAPLMQSVSDAVRVGYYHWCTGSVSRERAAAWARKASLYYAVDLDRNRRARAKARGEGCAYLFMHEDTVGELRWLLCCTSGDHPAHRLEKLRDARSARIELFGYELVRATRPGASQPAWTWRMTRSTYESWRAEIIDVVRRGDSMRVRQVVHSLYNVPGFAGIRKDTGKLVALMRKEWRTRRGTSELHLPSRLYYVERMRIDRMPLHVWLSLAARQVTALPAIAK